MKNYTSIENIHNIFELGGDIDLTGGIPCLVKMTIARMDKVKGCITIALDDFKTKKELKEYVDSVFRIDGDGEYITYETIRTETELPYLSVFADSFVENSLNFYDVSETIMEYISDTPKNRLYVDIICSDKSMFDVASVYTGLHSGKYTILSAMDDTSKQFTELLHDLRNNGKWDTTLKELVLVCYMDNTKYYKLDDVLIIEN